MAQPLGFCYCFSLLALTATYLQQQTAILKSWAFHCRKKKISSFNLFVFAMTYEPGFCFHKDWDGCVHPNQEETKSLTIHGLWPQFEDGTWPQFCSKETFDQKIIKEFGDELKKKWPDENNIPSDPFASTKLYEHEWSKHGTCSGLSQESYFRAALASYITPTPSTFIGDHYGSEVNAQELINAFGGDGIAFPQCKGKYFQGISFCFDRDKNSGQPTSGPTRCSGGTKKDLEKQLCKGMIDLEPFLNL